MQWLNKKRNPSVIFSAPIPCSDQTFALFQGMKYMKFNDFCGAALNELQQLE